MITGSLSGATALPAIGVLLFGPLEAPAEVTIRVPPGQQVAIAATSQDVSTPAGINASHLFGDTGASGQVSTRSSFRMNQGEELYAAGISASPSISWLVSYV